jgi:Na+/H+ antiporter NhaD/arsenite permease-like protein
VKKLPVCSSQEMEILFILFVLFITVNGLQRSGLMVSVSRRIESGGAVPLKLVLTTFFLSMVLTNDVALIIVVPLTLTLNIKRKDILVILEALAANSGSALTPFGNPQNLFIYWFYGLHAAEFLPVILPLSLVMLIILSLSTIFIKTGKVDYQLLQSFFSSSGLPKISEFSLCPR